MISRAELLEAVRYDPVTGHFFWRKKVSDKTVVGRRAGTIGQRGVVHISIYSKRYKAHRLAWLYVYGSWPERDIDHIDGDPSNNAAANLRLCTMTQNIANARRRSDNTSGYKGVYKSTYGKHRMKPWTAEIRCAGKRHHLGRFRTPEEAHAAYVAAAERLFGEFARAA